MKENSRTIILGLDGMPFSLMKKFIENGTMPLTKEIIKDGKLIQIDASIPDLSSVSWSSFITGKFPSEHGILGFVEIDPRSYCINFPNFLDNNCKTFWEKIGEEGKSSIVINVPGTYPVKPMNGILISGFPAVNIERAVYPSSLIKVLKKLNYKLDVDPPNSKDKLDLFFENLLDSMKNRMTVFKKLFDENNFDLFFACFTEIDRFHHFFFDVKNSEKYIKFYKILDRYISEIYSWCSEDDKFIMISDHGFTEIEQEFYINKWLNKYEFLENTGFKNGKLIVTSNTKAFALDPARIFIHLKEKYANGPVDSNEYEKVREEVIEELNNLNFKNKKVIKNAFKKEEIYSAGNSFEKAADIICLPEDGFDIKGAFHKKNLFGKSIFTGMHTQHDALFYINDQSFETNQKLNISEISNLFL